MQEDSDQRIIECYFQLQEEIAFERVGIEKRTELKAKSC